jgi:hypothetical protein
MRLVKVSVILISEQQDDSMDRLTGSCHHEARRMTTDRTPRPRGAIERFTGDESILSSSCFAAACVGRAWRCCSDSDNTVGDERVLCGWCMQKGEMMMCHKALGPRSRVVGPATPRVMTAADCDVPRDSGDPLFTINESRGLPLYIKVKVEARSTLEVRVS